MSKKTSLIGEPYRAGSTEPPKTFSTTFTRRLLLFLLAVIICWLGYDLWLRRAYARLPIRTVTVDRAVPVPGPIQLVEHCSAPPPCIESARSYAMGILARTPEIECPVGTTVRVTITGNISTIECHCPRTP